MRSAFRAVESPWNVWADEVALLVEVPADLVICRSSAKRLFGKLKNTAQTLPFGHGVIPNGLNTAISVA